MEAFGRSNPGARSVPSNEETQRQDEHDSRSTILQINDAYQSGLHAGTKKESERAGLSTAPG